MAVASVPARSRRRLLRIPVVALAIVALGGAVAGGLARLGWPLWVVPSVAAFHGPLMIGGFLGTLIGLERAVALGRGWGYGAPIGSGLGALAVMAGAPGGSALMLAGSAVLVLVSAEIVRRQVALFTAIMLLGAVCWLVAQIAWAAGVPVHRVVFWWAAFLVLTIAGERLELTRLMPLRPSRRATFLVAVGVLIAALALASVTPLGVTAIGVALIGLAAWLVLFDVARRTVRTSGLTRFIAVALLSGYVWLAGAGALAVRGGEVAAGPLYDAMLHALFVGFVFSMIFGHAPIIVPAVMGVRIGYRPAFYGHLGLLHLSLAVRVFGDLAPWPPGRAWGGLLNAVAIGVFFVNTAYGALRGEAAR